MILESGSVFLPQNATDCPSTASETGLGLHPSKKSKKNLASCSRTSQTRVYQIIMGGTSLQQTDGRMPVTRWSLIRAIQDPAQSEAALNELCRLYWYPLYAYARDWGCGHHEAEDRVQGFVADFVHGDSFASLSEKKGRFRGFLRRALKNYLMNCDRSKKAAKRGGGAQILSLDVSYDEGRYKMDVVDDRCTPEYAFDGRWAVLVIERTRARLNQEFAKRGQAEEFELLESHLFDLGDSSYGDLAIMCGKSAGALRTQVLRMRNRFRQLIKEEIVGTLSDPEHIEDELNYLREVIVDMAAPERRILEAVL